jgi:hypothetical protein
MIKKTIVLGISVVLLSAACKTKDLKMSGEKRKEITTENKRVVYQVFTVYLGIKKTQIINLEL